MRLYLTASGAEIGSEDARTELAEAQAAASCVHLSAVIAGSRDFVANPAEASRLCESLEQAAKAETSLEKAAAASTAAFDDEARKPVLFCFLQHLPKPHHTVVLQQHQTDVCRHVSNAGMHGTVERMQSKWQD